MIVSEKNKFVFVRGIKTASTSLTTALLPYHRSCEQWLAVKVMRRVANHLPLFQVRKAILYDFLHHPHTSAAKAQSLLDPGFWTSAYKFGVIRDPYSWSLSVYKHWRRCRDMNASWFPEIPASVGSLVDFLEFWRDTRPLLQCLQFVDEEGELCLNAVGSFSVLPEFVRHLQDQLGVEICMLRQNVSSNLLQYNLSARERKLVEEVSQLDFEWFDFDSAEREPIVAIRSTERTRRRTAEILIKAGGRGYDPWKVCADQHGSADRGKRNVLLQRDIESADSVCLGKSE